ncbi:MAG: glutaminase A [Alphaproteobacteria bacterium]|nr:glutaminase A [Alphaproteobacteria bacterium]
MTAKIKNKQAQIEPVEVVQGEELYQAIFNVLDEHGKGTIHKHQLLNALKEQGILESDPRIKETTQALALLSDGEAIDIERLRDIVRPNISLIERTIKRNLIIPDFKAFTNQIKAIFTKVSANKNGVVASYIPQLAKVNPEHFAVAVCTIDGQVFCTEEADIPYCVQSTCKPVNYCIALELNGEDKVHQHIGREPSGQSFNAISLNNKGLPHNPLINAGAILACSLIKNDEPLSDRFDHVMSMWTSLTGGITPGFNNSVYLSEKDTADRNFALAYFMREKKSFPAGVSIQDTLDFYFQCCSIELTARSQAHVAATLAHAGVSPSSGRKILNSNTVKDCLSLMYSCGMYDFSGEYAFTVGLPAKSGVSGALMIVVPGVAGITVWSPRLDEMGNSVRGIEFSKELVKLFNFHNYDGISGHTDKIDPRRTRSEFAIDTTFSLIWAASQGDINEIRRLIAYGIDLNKGDYDGRTALHLAAAEGQLETVAYLLKKDVEINPRDRWDGTPLTDAKRHKHADVATLLEQQGGIE